jgi:hypothetical protein
MFGSGSFGVPELVVLAIVGVGLAAVVWPASRILQRAGFSPWLALFAIVPLANICLLWFVAMSPWPAVSSADGS